MSQGLFDGFDAYERRKERARRDQAEQSATGRDIGPLPPIPPKALIIKDRCRDDLKSFLEFFLRPIFRLAWSEAHLEAIKTLEQVFLTGGQFAYAMPRGNGKTSLCIGATLWAMMYGHRRFIVPVCATGPKAEQMLESIKTIIETNSRLAKVFPEVCYPIAKLEGINNRVGGQVLNGERTRLKWTGKRLVLPTVADSAASGVIVHAAGLMGSVRGLSQASADDTADTDEDFWDTIDLDAAFEPEVSEDGGMIRPDASILDDPQTDESAKNPEQTRKRMQVIEKAILNLAGPDKKIAVACPCTVILPDDLADRLLDRERYPEWRGRRTKLLTEMPNEDAMKLWGDYREIRKESLREHEDIRLATEFYRKNHAAMRAGAVASWPERYESEHIDAIQYAMDKWCRSEEAFFAEYQNDPREEEESGIESLKAKDLLERCDGSSRGDVPEWSEMLTAFVDVQQDVLPWMVVAWGKELRGHIVDYGAWPEQRRKYYTLRELSPTLREATAEPTVEGAIAAGLDALVADLIVDYGSGLRWIGVDANWAISTEIVYSTARRHREVMPFHGRFFGATSIPLAQLKRNPGDKQGLFWRTKLEGRVRTIVADTNNWKTKILKRLKEPMESGRGIDWFGSKPFDHEMLCDQLSAEYSVHVTAKGKKADEWKNRPGRDNHWWDCLVGCAVGASLAGMSLAGEAEKPRRKRKSLKELHDEMQRRRA